MKALLRLESSFSSRILMNMSLYTNANMNFMYRAARANGVIAQIMYMERFQGRNLLISKHSNIFFGSCAYGEYFYALTCDTGTEIYHRIHALEKVILHTAEYSSSTNLRTIGHALHINRFHAYFHTWNGCQQALFYVIMHVD